MGISKEQEEQEEQARKIFMSDIEDVDEDDVNYASQKGNAKLKKFGDSPPGVSSSVQF